MRVISLIKHFSFTTEQEHVNDLPRWRIDQVERHVMDKILNAICTYRKGQNNTYLGWKVKGRGEGVKHHYMAVICQHKVASWLRAFDMQNDRRVVKPHRYSKYFSCFSTIPLSDLPDRLAHPMLLARPVVEAMWQPARRTEVKNC